MFRLIDSMFHVKTFSVLCLFDGFGSVLSFFVASTFVELSETISLNPGN